MITQALESLPFAVLWKFEGDDVSYKPANVLMKKWMPQPDILGKSCQTKFSHFLPLKSYMNLLLII